MDFHTVKKAIKRGDVVCIRHYLESGLEPDLANQYGWTLLMCAACEGNTAIGAELIQRGAQLDLRNQQGWTALSLAAHTRHPGFVRLLCASGASLEGHPFGSSFESFLEWASQFGAGSKGAMAKTKSNIKAAREAGSTKDLFPPPS